MLNKMELEQKLAAFDQLHLLHFWDELSDKQQMALADQLSSIDLARVTSVFDQFSVVHAEDVSAVKPITAEHYQSLHATSEEDRERYWLRGLEAIGRGEVAVIVLAGGQATRLGALLPKGTLPLDLLRKKDSLLELQAAQIVKLQTLAKDAHPDLTPAIQWFVMTSDATTAPTEKHMKERVLPESGLNADNVHFFAQAEMPCFTMDGKLMLAEKHRVATSPDGNGGLYRALKPLLGQMKALGVKYVHVYCVDNILCRVADPTFIGYCIDRDADCAAKAVEKVDPFEAVGTVCTVDGVPKVVEYSEISPELAQLKDLADPSKLAFRAGNICNHFFTVDFLDVVCGQPLPFHPANKKIPFVNEAGERTAPVKENGIKMEQFVFDVFRFSQAFYVWEVPRLAEFSPLKNSDTVGKDCPKTCRSDLWRVHRQWVEEAGGSVLPEEDGAVRVEIDAAVSYGGEGLKERVSGQTFQSPLILS